MRLAVISLNTEQKNLSRYYNSQAEGMAKALAAAGHEVSVYHLVPDLGTGVETVKKGGITAVYLKCRHLGKHAFINPDRLDKGVSCYITASDNYMFLGKFCRWCARNKILCLPYIGVVHSNNASAWKRRVVDIFCDNIKYYKKIPTIVKTPALAEELRSLGAKKIYTVPVGLDKTLLKEDYLYYNVDRLKEMRGFAHTDRVILFVGRMTAEKQPVKMIDIFNRVYHSDNNFRLVMVGQGELMPAVRARIAEYGLAGQITMYDRVPNDEMWELYRLSECYVNLNTHEIFGMAILEAMYYGSTVIALDAPGPALIIEDGRSGHVCADEGQIATHILADKDGHMSQNAKRRVAENFMWEKSACDILGIIRNCLQITCTIL